MTRRVWRLPLLAAAILSMVYGVWLGLDRVGWRLPLPWPDHLILHGPLMVGGFVGTLIGLERAIGVARRWAYLAPACSAAGAILLVFAPQVRAGALLITAASVIVSAVFVTLVRRHPSMSTVTFLIAALSWCAGNAAWVSGAAIYRVVFWWAAFLVLTIAAERLELNRVLRPGALARSSFAIAAGVLMAGALSLSAGVSGGVFVAGAGITGIAAWLATNDVARRTVRQRGVTRYMAVCLLAGYAWLIVAGLLLCTTPAGSPGTAYDAVLHAIFVGFVVSMIFGHAPIVLPAVTGIPLRYRPVFYAHLGILHASVAFRLIGDLVEDAARLRAWGALGNAVAIAWFAVATATSVGAARPIARPSALPSTR